ncbi:MAG: hypothetical protein ACFB51_02260 [Anaerolineae bacterium]
MPGSIVMRDVPKQEARIDLFSGPIQGGFRGFSLVPTGAHYVSVKYQASHRGAWCYVEDGSAAVLHFNEESAELVLVEDEEFRQLAASGAMSAALLPYPAEIAPRWRQQTSHIRPQDVDDFQVRPPQASSAGASRFDAALAELGEAGLLADFQLSYLTFALEPAPKEAFQRWASLLQSAYNAGEHRIAANSNFFAAFVDILIAQFGMISDDLLMAQTVTGYANYLIEDMEDTGIAELENKAAELKAYLRERGALS